FNYASFCKVLSINQVHYMIENMIEKLFKNPPTVPCGHYINRKVNIVEHELHKLFIDQIYSLKKLTYMSYSDTTFTIYPEAKDCMKNLSVLKCNSDINSEFFYQLSQICHNLQIFYIKFNEVISNGLADLISVQKNLKSLSLDLDQYSKKFINDIIPSLTKISSSLIKFNFSFYESIPLSFIAKFTNLQINLIFDHTEAFEDFKKLQYVTFSQLQILRISYSSPKVELLINFLEINGKTLREFYLRRD